MRAMTEWMPWEELERLLSMLWTSSRRCPHLICVLASGASLGRLGSRGDDDGRSPRARRKDDRDAYGAGATLRAHPQRTEAHGVGGRVGHGGRGGGFSARPQRLRVRVPSVLAPPSKLP